MQLRLLPTASSKTGTYIKHPWVTVIRCCTYLSGAQLAVMLNLVQYPWKTSGWYSASSFPAGCYQMLQ
jgi:hypothetical protein